MRKFRMITCLACLIFVASTTLPMAFGDEFEDEMDALMARGLTPDEIADGWISLFDGESLYGWKNEGDADFHVRDGVILATRGSEPCLLRTTSQFDNYKLRVQFLSDEGTNSGVFLHSPPRPTRPDVDCYELNIADVGTSPFPTGSLVGRIEAEEEHDTVGWQTFTITVLGDHITVELDGKEMADYVDPRPLGRGCIGLQFNSGKIAFAAVHLKPLTLEPLYNGRDLDGWMTHPDLGGTFEVDTDGSIRVKGGRGQLESVDHFADFTLQLRCKTHARGLNSGVFLRCIPGEMMNGYESQIHNGFLDGDRNRPLDCGTGGIFRQQDARRVVADDLEWLHKTIVVHGGHFSVWVNGYQVSDWTDGRAADDNPRRGRRLEAGSIMLQAHDETTDISFDDIQASEMTKRNR